ncbi:S8 family serine peptidase [Tamlana agarivorans]|uniref:S8 family serine peptidase n=1 Tax=Pseudotamlana agarivorans TaxID=481183 RepID=A0ACC5UAX9_9FLAO|nr:S8 family serine peptidase [Tamlana agarivorans]MBU2951477.1 S8 family serine peptidase [Tamlana agarivorans]
MKKKLLYLSVLLFQCAVFAQVQDAWVYFVDKENVSASINNPISILSQKAIDRKRKAGIAIDFRDVPVNENYIAQLKNTSGISVLAKSKWYNAVHVRGLKTDIDNLNSNPSLSFIDAIDFADKRLNAKRRVYSKSAQVSDKFSLENETVDFVYGNTQNQVEMIQVDQLHQNDFTGEGITIAVLDAAFTNVNTMTAFQRLRTAGDLKGGYDFVDGTYDVYAYTPPSGSISHGTQVLSCMAGFVTNEYVGTAPDATYYLFRTEDGKDENPVEESYWVEAAERADSLGVDIINTSLGYQDYGPNYPNYTYTSDAMDGNTAFITRGSNIAFEKGLLLVTSAGNSGNSGVGAPADSPNVLSVGAVDASGQYASFSSIGSSIQPSQKPDVVAKGYRSNLINRNDVMVQNNGTSFSGPIMAGGVACLMQALPNKTPTEIMGLVRGAGSQFNTPDYQLGYGIPDLYQALQKGLSSIEFNSLAFKIYPNPVNSNLFIDFGTDESEAQLKLFNVLGVLVLETVVNNKKGVSISHLPQGLYLGEIQLENETRSFKIIKK